MKHPERIDDYLSHILQAIDKILHYIAPISDLSSFEENGLIQDAVVRNIEIIGEASGRIEKADLNFIQNYPEVPWIKMRAMRNVLIHDYDTLIISLIWKTIKNDLPDLREQIIALLAKRQSD